VGQQYETLDPRGNGDSVEAQLLGFHRIVLRIGSVLMVLLAMGGCPERKGAATPTTCTEAYAQCMQLPSGPLGICNPTDCSPGQKPPCLKCVGQH